MGDVLKMDLPWRSLASKVARFNNNGMIDYKSTFEDNEIVFGLMKDDTVSMLPTLTDLVFFPVI